MRGEDLAERAVRSEARLFVGRRDLLDQLSALVAEADREPRVVAVLGPGGVGKTTLVRRLAHVLNGRRIVWLSGERLTPSPAAFEEAVQERVDGGLSALGRGAMADVLVLDAFERLTPIARWVLEEALLKAGARLAVLLTTRARLSARTRLALGTCTMLREVTVPRWNDAEASQYLSLRSVPSAVHSELLACAAGHPLALSLIAERFALTPHTRAPATEAKDVIDALVQEFLREAPSVLHEQGLYALSLPPALDESLLSAMLACPAGEARAVYRWLESLTFVERGTDGIAPHALVRGALYERLMRAQPDLHVRMAQGASEQIFHRIETASALTGHERMMRALYLRRGATPTLSAFGLDHLSEVYLGTCSEDTLAEYAALVQKWEGDASAARFRAAFAHDPGLIAGIHGANQALLALVGYVSMRDMPAALRQGDPILEAGYEHYLALADENESDLLLGRWMMTAAGYQTLGPELVYLITAGPFVTSQRAPRVRYAMGATTPPESWEPLAAPYGLKVAGYAEMNGQRYLLTVADVHAQVGRASASETAARLARLHFHNLAGLPLPRVPPAVQGLDFAGFAQALRNALPLLPRPRELANSPLLQSHLAAGAGMDGVTRAIEAACRELAEQRGYRESARVLRTTYLQGVSKQEAAAIELGLPYGTYRHRLRRAIADLTTWLWERERRAASPEGQDT